LKLLMIVDDEKDIRESVKLILEKHNYKVVTAKDGDDCLEKLKKFKPDLILMDIMMPGTPVKEVAEKIHGPKIAYLSILKRDDAERENMISEDYAGYIQKPFEINQLVNSVNKLVA